MRVIVLASQKGGVGKTTLAGHLAVQADLQKAGPVAVMDADPMGSLSHWWNRRQQEGILFARMETLSLRQRLSALDQKGVKLVFIDTPPQVSVDIRRMVDVADLVVIPSRPSPHDLRAVGATVDLVQSCGKPLIFVVNGAAHRARLTTDAAVRLSQHGAVAPTIVHHRTDFASSMINGQAVQELFPKSRSAEEIAALWEYVSDRLRHKKERARHG